MGVQPGKATKAADADERLLNAALQNLKKRGHIAFTGEFGAEIATFIPFAAWLKQEGLLEGRRVVSYRGMRPYYSFLSDDQFEARSGRRDFVPAAERKWPTNMSHTATRQRWHARPDYRSHYKDRGRTFERPVLFVQNKFQVEWDTGPINYLPLGALEQLFRAAAGRYHVVYSRPRDSIEGRGYTGDHNTNCDYPDLDLARRFKGVEILEESCIAAGLDYNTAKLEILAKTHVFVAAQGGGTHLLACFGNSLLLVLHRQGREYPHAYAAGPYKYLADPPPLLLVAQTNDQLIQGMQIVAATAVEGGAPVIADRALPLVAGLRM
jgi:hypothetical protein